MKFPSHPVHEYERNAEKHFGHCGFFDGPYSASWVERQIDGKNTDVLIYSGEWAEGKKIRRFSGIDNSGSMGGENIRFSSDSKYLGISSPHCLHVYSTADWQELAKIDIDPPRPMI